MPPDLTQSRDHYMWVWGYPIVVKFDRRLGSTAAEAPVKFHNDTLMLTLNPAASKLNDIWWQDILSE